MRRMLRLRAFLLRRDFLRLRPPQNDHDVAPRAQPAPAARPRPVEPPQPRSSRSRCRRSFRPPAPVACTQTPRDLDPDARPGRVTCRERQPVPGAARLPGASESANVSRRPCRGGARAVIGSARSPTPFEAFRNLGTFNRGEEDFATTTPSRCFETGRYDDAKKGCVRAAVVQITSMLRATATRSEDGQSASDEVIARR